MNVDVDVVVVVNVDFDVVATVDVDVIGVVDVDLASCDPTSVKCQEFDRFSAESAVRKSPPMSPAR